MEKLPRYGMDHDYYRFSLMQQREPLRFPHGARLAVWINVSVQHFPLDPKGIPFKAAGAMQTPYPDLRHYSLRDYGNRIGIYRVLDALERFSVPASFAINADLVERYPALLDVLAAQPGEWLGHGIDMDLLMHDGMTAEAQQALIERALALLARYPKPVRGWLSPARQQSYASAAALKRAGLRFMVDWVNDELPYRYQTDAGALDVLPLSLELEDRFVLMHNQHSEQSWLQQVCDAFDCLYLESEQAGRMLSLSLHPWVIGQPHRIGKLEQALAYFAQHEGVWFATPSELLDAADNDLKTPPSSFCA
jgi:peptidoglycan/xylan/chitin deacetylase (PgdA/CDA1 family)